MDTVINIPITIIDNPDSIKVADLSEDNRFLIENYVAMTRDIIEAHQLFEVLYFNLLNMRNSFVFKLNDTVTRTEHFPEYDEDYYAVNSLTINLISASRTLVDFLCAVAKTWLDSDTNSKDTFNTYVSKIYDKSFTYRFMINLRNYVQHGYLPLSSDGKKYCFDMNQILSTPHFNFKESFKTDMETFLETLQRPGENIACLSLTISIAEFFLDVTNIYKKFLNCFYKKVSSTYMDIKKLIKEQPNIICDYHKDFMGFIFYGYDKHMYHAINTNNDPKITIQSYKKRVLNIYKDEKFAYDELFSHLTIIKDKHM